MAPEALNAVDVMRALRELIIIMIDSIMLTVADINRAVVAAPPAGVDYGFEAHAPPNSGPQSGLPAVGRGPRVNASVTPEDAGDDRLAVSPAASHPSSAEVMPVDFDPATGERRGALAPSRDAPTDLEEGRGDAAARQPCRLSRITSRQIEREVANQGAGFTPPDFRPPVIAV